mmetsp:Transcript_13385/g.31952  ORF Transcript_13385/g.31952 Transcript_13385/m.31952 type:complete len:124 (-) Transcript_13385:342-713(-)
MKEGRKKGRLLTRSLTHSDKMCSLDRRPVSPSHSVSTAVCRGVSLAVGHRPLAISQTDNERKMTDRATTHEGTASSHHQKLNKPSLTHSMSAFLSVSDQPKLSVWRCKGCVSDITGLASFCTW